MDDLHVDSGESSEHTHLPALAHRPENVAQCACPCDRTTELNRMTGSQKQTAFQTTFFVG
jgi:hypothetical protein